ncbi:MAG: hypothetical protein BMS9Abin10_1090 [Gammaproteobacteria bacterium]|nr:MAG: hypothetical protein BMS9Abin10_1090 [Gammaproteobacteria bacterium]
MTRLQCPKCAHDRHHVTDSRSTHSKTGGVGSVWRRRQCDSCRRRFTTYEISEKDFDAFLAYRKAVALLNSSS